MRELRAVLVMVPPLLVDLIQQVVAARAERLGFALSILAEISDPRDVGEHFSRLSPDVIIFGPATAASQWTGPPLPPHVRILTLSSDLSQILGPGEGQSALLTPDGLAQCLGDISRSI